MKPAIPRLQIDQIQDLYTRENFKVIRDFLEASSLFFGFRLFEVDFPQAEANRKIPHALGFVPKDILATSTLGSGVVTFNQALSTRTELDLSATGPCVVRFLAGTFGE